MELCIIILWDYQCVCKWPYVTHEMLRWGCKAKMLPRQSCQTSCVCWRPWAGESERTDLGTHCSQEVETGTGPSSTSQEGRFSNVKKKKVSVESLFIKKATLSSGTEFLTQPGRSLLQFLNIKQNKDHEKLPHQNSILHIYFSLYIWYTLQKVVALPQIY